MANRKNRKAKQAEKPNDQVKYQIHMMHTRFLKSLDVMRAKHQKWAEIDQFDRGEQWKNAPIPPWVPKPVTNYLRYVRTLKRANLASAIPQPTFYAEYEEDKEVVRRLQKAHDHVWETEKVPRTVRRCIDRALKHGTAIAYVYVDDAYVGGRYYGENDARNRLFQGKICVKAFPITNFFPDPDAFWLDECKWIDTTELVPLKRIKENPAFRKYCKEQGTLDKLDALNTEEMERDDSASGTIYDRDYKPTDGGVHIEGDEMVTLHCHWERYFENGEWHLDVTYYLRNTDFFLLQLKDVQPNEYPFAILYDEEEDNDLWGTSTLMDIMENQKIVNKLQQTAAIIGVLHQNPQKVVWRESGINAQELARTGTLPGKVWSSNVPGDQAVTVLKPMEIPRGLLEVDDRTQKNIRDMVGVNEAYTGQSVGSLTTSTGVADLIERATVRDKDKMIQIDEFVERISHLIVLHIIHKWQDERPITTTAPNGSSQFEMWQPIDPLDAKNLSWRVKSNVYAKAPMTQAAKRQQADKLMQMQGQFEFDPPLITPEEWLRLQDFEDAEDIMLRMERDRARMESERAQNFAAQMAEVARAIADARAQGASEQEIMQVAAQMAQEILSQASMNERRNGRTPQAEPQMPKGVTGQVQLANMANGY